MPTTNFVYPFIIDTHLGFSHLLTIIDNATINMSVQVLCGCMSLFPLNLYLGVKLLGRMITLRLIELPYE